MKRRIIVVLTLTLLVSFQVSAQKPKAYRLKTGDKFVVNVEVTQRIEQEIMGQSQVTGQDMLTVDEYEVVRNEGGTILLKTTGLSRKLTISGVMDVTMDSSSDDETSEPLKVLTGKSYFITVDTYGKVLKIEGLEEMRDQMREELKSTIVAGQTDQILNQVNEDVIRTSFEGFFHIYSPDRKKKWKRDYEVTINNLPVAVSTEFVREKQKKLVATGSLSIAGDIDVQGMTVAADMSGTQVSTFVLDKKTGLSKTVETKQDMTGQLNLQSFDVPMTMSTVTKVTVSW